LNEEDDRERQDRNKENKGAGQDAGYTAAWGGGWAG